MFSRPLGNNDQVVFLWNRATVTESSLRVPDKIIKITRVSTLALYFLLSLQLPSPSRRAGISPAGGTRFSERYFDRPSSD